MSEPEADNLRLAQNAPQDVDLSDETQDFRFLSFFAKSSDQTSIPKRGEKDFEPDGTDLQERVLNDSRQAMHDALCGERKHTSKSHVAAIWHPEKQRAHVRDPKGALFLTMGKADRSGVWLLPEETIYMVERGSLECWWEEGIPMSLQGVYASCLEYCGIERYQVFAYLKRAGYIIQRASTFNADQGASSEISRPPTMTLRTSTAAAPGLFPQIFNALFGPRPPPAYGPIVTPGTYRSYDSIYERLALVPAHRASKGSMSPSDVDAKAPFRIAYSVWKPRPSFKKASPPPCDFHLAVVNARETSVPTLEQVAALLESVPIDEKMAGKHPMQRLKEGNRNVILAVVDSGVTSFMKFGDSAFGDELIYQQKVGRGGKYSRGGGRGGRGGRGRGRR